jgi:hypothetical protein
MKAETVSQKDPIFFIGEEAYSIMQSLCSKAAKEAAEFVLSEKNKDELLTQEQAAKLLCITKQTLISYQKKGRLNAHRLGKRTYYKRGELLSFADTKVA